MGKLIIKRSSEWNNMGRNFRIYIDGIKMGKIADGEKKEFNLENGKHSFKAKIDWCGSKTLDLEIDENEPKTIRLTGFKYANFLFPTALGFMMVYFLIKYILEIEFDNLLFALGGVMFLYLFYFLTFGKNRYIRATEIGSKTKQTEQAATA